MPIIKLRRASVAVSGNFWPKTLSYCQLRGRCPGIAFEFSFLLDGRTSERSTAIRLVNLLKQVEAIHRCGRRRHRKPKGEVVPSQ